MSRSGFLVGPDPDFCFNCCVDESVAIIVDDATLVEVDDADFERFNERLSMAAVNDVQLFVDNDEDVSGINFIPSLESS